MVCSTKLDSVINYLKEVNHISDVEWEQIPIKINFSDCVSSPKNRYRLPMKEHYNMGDVQYILYEPDGQHWMLKINTLI
jgi:hypothetical protein